MGSRAEFEQTNCAEEAHDTHPVMNPTTFALEDLNSAYQYRLEQRHFGKAGIEVHKLQETRLMNYYTVSRDGQL